MKKIVILNGSPRKGGNTELLIRAFCEGVSPEKYETETISVSDVHVNGCIGCNSCRVNTGKPCFQKDDMQTIYPKLAEADIIVVATPVYFYGVSSQLKAIIDRLHSPYRKNFKVKELVLLSVCADTIPTVFDSIERMYESVLSYFNLQDGGRVLVKGVEPKGAICGNEKLEEARKLGESL